MNDEREIFKQLLNKSKIQLRNEFDCEFQKDAHVFKEKANPDHYIRVCEKAEEFHAPINANFDFSRPAGSNNYSELFDVAEKFYDAFELEPTEYLKRCFDNRF